MAKIQLSTGFSVEVRPTPLLGLQHAREKLRAEEEAAMPERPYKDVPKAGGGTAKVAYRPPPPGKEPAPGDGEEYEFYQWWLWYLQERGRVETELELKMRQTTLRYALSHSVFGVRLPTRERAGLGRLLWLPLRLLDVGHALLSGQPVPPADWEEKARYFGLDFGNEIERRLAYYYSVVLGSELDANLIIGAARLMGPPEGGVESAKLLFQHLLARAAAEGLPGAGADGADELQPLEALDEGGEGEPDDAG